MTNHLNGVNGRKLETAVLQKTHVKGLMYRANKTCLSQRLHFHGSNVVPGQSALQGARAVIPDPVKGELQRSEICVSFPSPPLLSPFSLSLSVSLSIHTYTHTHTHPHTHMIKDTRK